MVSLSDFAESNQEKEPTEWVTPNTENTENTTPVTTETTSVTATSASTEVANSGNSTTLSLATTPSTQTNTDEILNSLMGQIKPIGETSYLKVLLYGEPGSGKSSIAATASNNLIYDLEDGLVAAKQSPHGIADNVRAIPFQSWEQSKALLGTLQKRPPELESFEVFTIDTLSELHKRGLQEVTEREHRKRPSSNRFVAETEHHTENNERIVRFFRALRDLDRHLIVIAHSRTVEPKNRPAKTFPDFSESLSNKIMAFMDVVGYMEMRKIDGNIVPVARFISNGQIAAKNRIGLPEEVANPTFSQIKKYWENSRNAE